jgi:hypothetical protein
MPGRLLLLARNPRLNEGSERFMIINVASAAAGVVAAIATLAGLVYARQSIKDARQLAEETRQLAAETRCIAAETRRVSEETGRVAAETRRIADADLSAREKGIRAEKACASQALFYLVDQVANDSLLLQSEIRDRGKRINAMLDNWGLRGELPGCARLGRDDLTRKLARSSAGSAAVAELVAYIKASGEPGFPVQMLATLKRY